MRKIAALVVLLTVACGPRPGPRHADSSGREELAEEGGSTSFEGLGSEVILAAAMKYPPRVEVVPPPPIALTASDGTGLVLSRYEARGVVDGPLAFTELRLRFRNPRPV